MEVNEGNSLDKKNHYKEQVSESALNKSASPNLGDK